MGGQHFTMRIYVYTGALRLLKQLLKVGQVMSGNQDRRVVPDTDINFCDFGITKP